MSKCILHIGAVNKGGYGKVADGNGGWILAHRKAWTDKFGPIPKGLCVCHECDNPPCKNTGHLFLGTRLQNTEDMIAKGRNRGAVGERNKKAKLTQAKVKRIRKDRRLLKFIAADYGVSLVLVSKIRRRLLWRHIA